MLFSVFVTTPQNISGDAYFDQHKLNSAVYYTADVWFILTASTLNLLHRAKQPVCAQAGGTGERNIQIAREKGNGATDHNPFSREGENTDNPRDPYPSQELADIHCTEVLED